MFIVSLLLVVASGLTHAVWSLFTKRSHNKSVFLWTIVMVTTIGLLPYLIRELWMNPLSLKAYGFLLLSACLQSVYALLLARTYNMGDLSQVYPIMRGTSTLFIPIGSVLFLLGNWNEGCPQVVFLLRGGFVLLAADRLPR